MGSVSRHWQSFVRHLLDLRFRRPATLCVAACKHKRLCLQTGPFACPNQPPPANRQDFGSVNRLSKTKFSTRLVNGYTKLSPYRPIGGVIPLHRYRAHKKTRQERRAERVEALAGKLELVRSAVIGDGPPAGRSRRHRRSLSYPSPIPTRSRNSRSRTQSAPSWPSLVISASRWPGCQPSRWPLSKQGWHEP